MNHFVICLFSFVIQLSKNFIEFINSKILIEKKIDKNFFCFKNIIPIKL
jgi:hypothetical protein